MSETFNLKTGDTAPLLDAQLLDNEGNTIDLTGANVVFELFEPRGSDISLESAMDVIDADSGNVRYEWADGDTDTPGRYRAQFVVTYPNDDVETFPSDGYHDVLIQQ